MRQPFLFAPLCAVALILSGGCASRQAPLRIPFQVTQEPGNILRINHNAEITIRIEGHETSLTPADIRTWVITSAHALTQYFGHFPVPRLNIDVRITANHSGIDGRTFDGRQINMRLAADKRPADLKHDWVMIHEMFHLAFPQLPREMLWMNEGLSTYLEPIARVRIGNMTADEMWMQFIDQMPQGLPRPGDRGLDQTHTWGRIYWGGAMYWLLADVRIRQETRGKKSLDDAIRGILSVGGSGAQEWSVDRVVSVGDRFAAAQVLRRLYDRYGKSPAAPDLQKLWRDLGVRKANHRIVYDDRAPLAWIRQAMTARAR